MTIAEPDYPNIVRVDVDEQWITATFVDGRRISIPLWWSWRLEQATPAQRENWRLIALGEGVHWAEVDEDLSARGFFVGTPAPRPRAKSS